MSARWKYIKGRPVAVIETHQLNQRMLTRVGVGSFVFREMDETITQQFSNSLFALSVDVAAMVSGVETDEIEFFC